MPYNTPFLQLDELRQKRNEQFGDQVKRAAKTFGDLPLTIDNLRKAAEDRESKRELEAAAEARAVEDQKIQGTQETRAAEKYKADVTAEKLKAAVGGQITAPKPEYWDASALGPRTDQDVDYTTIQNIKRDPVFADVSDDEIRHELSQTRAAKEKVAFDRSYKQGGLAARLRGLDQGDERLRLAEEALDRADERLDLSRQRMEMELEKMKDLPPDVRKKVHDLNAEAEALGRVARKFGKGKIEPGFFSQLARDFRAFIKHPDPSSEEASIMRANIENAIVRNFGGAALTAVELARVLSELPDPYTSPEAFAAALEAAIKVRIDQKDSYLVSTAETSPSTAHNAAVKDAVHRRQQDHTVRQPVIDSESKDPAGAVPPREQNEKSSAYAKRLHSLGKFSEKQIMSAVMGK